MTRNEMMLIDQCNQLIMMVFLQEVRARILAEQNRQANEVIEMSAKTLRDMTEALLWQVTAYNDEGERIC